MTKIPVCASENSELWHCDSWFQYKPLFQISANSDVYQCEPLYEVAVLSLVTKTVCHFGPISGENRGCYKKTARGKEEEDSIKKEIREMRERERRKERRSTHLTRWKKRRERDRPRRVHDSTLEKRGYLRSQPDKTPHVFFFFKHILHCYFITKCVAFNRLYIVNKRK